MKNNVIQCYNLNHCKDAPPGARVACIPVSWHRQTVHKAKNIFSLSKQQSPPSNWQSSMFDASLQYPFPIHGSAGQPYKIKINVIQCIYLNQCKKLPPGARVACIPVSWHRQIVQKMNIILSKQQSPPSNWQSAMFVWSLQVPSPILSSSGQPNEIKINVILTSI
jgi:hypothetical protein